MCRLVHLPESEDFEFENSYRQLKQIIKDFYKEYSGKYKKICLFEI